jgi:hypothetical protein
MAYGFLENYYTQARQKGIIFIQYSVDDKPRVEVENGQGSFSVPASLRMVKINWRKYSRWRWTKTASTKRRNTNGGR